MKLVIDRCCVRKFNRMSSHSRNFKDCFAIQNRIAHFRNIIGLPNGICKMNGGAYSVQPRCFSNSGKDNAAIVMLFKSGNLGKIWEEFDCARGWGDAFCPTENASA